MKIGTPFFKMHTLGNDFMLTDGIRCGALSMPAPMPIQPKIIRSWANRHQGIGFDQLLCAEPPRREDADFFMRIYNADGSEAGQCGNGLRCFYVFVRAVGLTMRDSLAVETAGGLARVEGAGRGNITSYLDKPDMSWQSVFTPGKVRAQKNPTLAESLCLEPDAAYPPAARQAGAARTKLTVWPVSVGNPHLIVFASQRTGAAGPDAMLAAYGEQLARHPALAAGANVGFVFVADRDNLILRTYERGSGPTLACGSNSCAAAALAMEKRMVRSEVTVHNLGGRALVGCRNKIIYMRSRVHRAYRGILP